MTIAIPKQTRPFILAFVGHRHSPDETILAANGEVGNFKNESHQLWEKLVALGDFHSKLASKERLDRVFQY